MASLRQLYFNRRIGLMLPLGFASGLPLALTGGTLAAWARDAGVSLTGIGLLSLVSWPYALKFLWAPWIDRYCPPVLDRRRGWMLIFQLLLIAAIASMAFFEPKASPTALAAVAACVAFFSASLDIPTDAYRTDILDDSQRGSGSAIFVSGYRLGMVVSSGLALVLADTGLSWHGVYLVMSSCMAIGLVATLFSEPTPSRIAAPVTLDEAIVAPLMQFLLRPGGWLIIAFIIIFKLPDITALAPVTTPFLMDMGISKTEIGAVSQGVGIAISICGAIAGGVLVGKIGLTRSLVAAGILHGVANIGFLFVAQFPTSRTAFIGAIGAENFVYGLVGAAFTAFLMAHCDRRYSAFQFALLSACMALSRTLGTSAAGYVADHVGWTRFFLIVMALAVPGIAMIPLLPQPTKEERGFEVITASAENDAGERD